MFERLHALKNQYEELQRRMELPETYSEPRLYARCEREARELQPLVEAYAAWERTEQTMASARELMEDPEMRQLAQEEYQEAREERERLEREIKILLLPKDPNDSKNVIMEIRGGVGGEEGMLFAADLYRMYAMYAEKRGWKLEIANLTRRSWAASRRSAFSSRARAPGPASSSRPAATGYSASR